MMTTELVLAWSGEGETYVLKPLISSSWPLGVPEWMMPGEERQTPVSLEALEVGDVLTAKAAVAHTRHVDDRLMEFEKFNRSLDGGEVEDAKSMFFAMQIVEEGHTQKAGTIMIAAGPHSSARLKKRRSGLRRGAHFPRPMAMLGVYVAGA